MSEIDVTLSNLKICKYPDPVLRTPAKPIDRVNERIQRLADRMTDLMLEQEGIGLAATQVGVALRMFLMCLDGRRENVQVFINPELSDFQGWSDMEEGCLSVPGIRAKVRRPASCTVRALNLEGNRFVYDAVDLAAICVQHESDHLEGKLFIDRLSPLAKIACRKAIKTLEREYSK